MPEWLCLEILLASFRNSNMTKDVSKTDEGLNGGGGGGPHVGCWLKFHYFVGCRLNNFRPLSVVGKSQLIFLLLVGNFFLVLSVVSNIFSPFVASRLTPFRPSQM